ncbi:hypothetical protein C1645_837513 [Glomus cerebriforme]|uniref:Uncharacterized protein n=1 Tax=Glomus cerebriforme TaxID=658196 RepID=A0A397S3X2_9GLOM|nr:hypothetical protein C1645_837513 [Glomus cerebriforme]
MDILCQTERSDTEISCQGINPQSKGNNTNKKNDNWQQWSSDSRIKNTRNTSVAIVSFECCSNKRAIQNLLPPLGNCSESVPWWALHE